MTGKRQAKYLLDESLVDWLAQYSRDHDRKPSYVVNQQLNRWRRSVESARERRRKRSGGDPNASGNVAGGKP